MTPGKNKNSSKKTGDDDRFRDIARNRRAFFEYEILERFEAGIALVGTEVKGLRDRGASIVDAWVSIRDGEAWLMKATIHEYANAGYARHEPQRDRKLLLHRRELDKLQAQLAERGLSLIPLRMYFKDGRAKLELGLARGKTLHDKRRTIVERETRREAARAMKRG